jgi:hypothetical protein
MTPTPGPGGQFDHLLKNMKSRVQGQESRIETEESRVNTPESEDKPIGEAKAEPRVKSIESRIVSAEPRPRDQQSHVERVDSREESLEPRVDSLDTRALEEAIEEAIIKPKLGVYSPLAAAMLRYKAITTPRYSMGAEMKTIIEQALKETYPKLYEEVLKRMSED